MGIELILLGVIATVVVTDFILRGLKKKSSNDEDIPKIEDQFNDIIKENKFSYILSRKRNIITFLLLTAMIKPVIHFAFFENQEEFINYDKKISFGDYNSNTYYKDSIGTFIKFNRTPRAHYLRTIEEKLDETFDAIPAHRRSLYTQNGELIQRNTTLIQNESMANSIAVNYYYYPKELKKVSFKKYLNTLFTDEIWIFSISFAIIGLISFLFNDKIKAR